MPSLKSETNSNFMISERMDVHIQVSRIHSCLRQHSCLLMVRLFLAACIVSSFNTGKTLRVPFRRSFKSSVILKMSDKKDLVQFTHLSKNQFAVLRQAATEPAGFSENTPGELEHELKRVTGSKLPKEGTFECQACGTPLYTAESKFDSGCGWPAFYQGIEGAVEEKPDPDGRRIEIVCAKCKSHLGHVFKGEGFSTPTNERHCVNGICLAYQAEK